MIDQLEKDKAHLNKELELERKKFSEYKDGGKRENWITEAQMLYDNYPDIVQHCGDWCHVASVCINKVLC